MNNSSNYLLSKCLTNSCTTYEKQDCHYDLQLI